jgi:hypothetical protein
VDIDGLGEGLVIGVYWEKNADPLDILAETVDHVRLRAINHHWHPLKRRNAAAWINPRLKDCQPIEQNTISIGHIAIFI